MRTPRAGTAPRPGGTPPRGHLSAGHRGPKACRASQGTGTASCRPWDVTSKCGHFAGRPGQCSIDGTLHTSPWKRVARTRRPSEGVAAGRGDTDPPGRSHTPPPHCRQQELGCGQVRPSPCVSTRGRPRPHRKFTGVRLSRTLGTCPEARRQGTEKTLWRRAGLQCVSCI